MSQISPEVLQCYLPATIRAKPGVRDVAHLTIDSLIFDELDQVDLTGPHGMPSRRRAT
jgi:hypothetical protein